MATTTAHRYARTAAGRAQFLSQTIPLSRPARNLLMVIDDSRTGDQWVQQVHGSCEADLQQLISAGLIGTASQAEAAEQVKSVTLEEALQRWNYNELYALLTAEARERFGLLRGYRLILQIEGSTNIEELRAVALKFVENVRKSHGAEPATRLCRQFGAG